MRISGTNIPDNKRLEIALTYVLGIGPFRSKKILEKVGISGSKKAKELSEKESGSVRDAVEKYKIEGDLRRDVSSNIKRLKEIKCYRGSRHMRQLPSRGQRTKTNSRTVRPYKGKMTMGSGRRKDTKK